MTSGLPLLLASLEEHAHRSAGATALVTDGHQLTYGALVDQIHQMAGGLRRLGLQTGQRVGVMGYKSADAVVALLGVLRAGASYVPLDPRAPMARQAELLRDAECRFIVVSGEDARIAGQLGTTVPIEVVDAVGLINSDVPVEKPPASIGLDEIAYCMYTSGSTGRPKGVQIPHRALTAFFTAVAPLLDIEPTARCLNTSALHFDVSVVDLLFPLVRGATVYLGPPFPAPPLLVRLIEEERITHMAAVGSTLTLLAQRTNGFHGRDLSSLRRVMTGAEILNPTTVQQWLAAAPDLVVINGYGPTEATCLVIAHQIRERESGRTEMYPIGMPLSGVQICFLDGDHINDHGPGEILIAGDQVMTGYFRCPKEQERGFMHVNGTTFYRTGDLGHRRTDGVILFSGRRDDEVKIRGYRVNLNEVRRIVETHSDVGCAFVSPVTDRRGVQVLTCAIALPATPASAGPDIPKPDGLLIPLGSDLTRSVRDHVSAQVPGYMVPATFLLLDAIPVLSSGKPDAARIHEALQRTQEDSVTTTPSPRIRIPVQRLGWFNDRDEQLRDKIASHLQQDVLPRVRAWTAQRYIQLGDVFSGFGQRRWLGRRLPARLGGLDATVWQHVVLTECLGELLCEGFAEAVIAHNDIALPLLAEQAHPKIVDQYLRPALQGRVILTHVVLPAVSSTLAPPSAVAVPVPSGYRVNGTLPAVVAAQQADVFVVLAHILDKGSPRGDVVLLIPATERGVSLEPIAPIQRTLSNGTATANLTEVFVPGEALVATQEAVPAMLRQMQDQQRVMSAARMVALADRVLRLTIEYLGTRRAFGIEMRRHQAIQFRLADLAAQLDGVRQLTYTTVNFWASGEEYSRLAAAAELRAIRIARLVCHQCLHLHGAAGQIEDHPVGHAFLDVHITSVTAEPDQVLLSKIADFPEWTHG